MAFHLGDISAVFNVLGVALPVHHVKAVLLGHMVALLGGHVPALDRVVDLLADLLGDGVALFLCRDILALIMGFLLADLLLNLLALSLMHSLLHRGVLGLALPLARGGALVLVDSLALLVEHGVALPVVHDPALLLLNILADIIVLCRTFLVGDGVALSVDDEAALLVEHLLALFIIDGIGLGLLHILALHLGDSVALVLVLELAVPPCHIVHLIVTVWNIVGATLFLVLGGDHGLLLCLAHVVHHRGALLVGVILALLLGDLIVHSLVLSPALLAILGMTLHLVGVLNVRLLDILTLHLGDGVALVFMLLHIGCRGRGQKAGEEDQLHDEIADAVAEAACCCCLLASSSASYVKQHE